MTRTKYMAAIDKVITEWSANGRVDDVTPALITLSNASQASKSIADALSSLRIAHAHVSDEHAATIEAAAALLRSVRAEIEQVVS